jgi:hypothetical protein
MCLPEFFPGCFEAVRCSCSSRFQVLKNYLLYEVRWKSHCIWSSPRAIGWIEASGWGSNSFESSFLCLPNRFEKQVADDTYHVAANPWIQMMRTFLLCIQCKDRLLEYVRDSWISRYVLTLSIIFQNLRLVPCLYYWLGTIERTSKDLEKAKESRRWS